jgi:glutamine amidotransferase
VTKLTVGIVDYGVGNHNSVHHTLNHLGLRCRVSDDHMLLKACDLLLLPGVGAFRPAIQALKSKGLDRFLVDQVARQKPILGICLGMQLLGKSSSENGRTTGLGLIPGDVVRLDIGSCHIGWNSVTLQKPDQLFEVAHNQDFYFNHSYAYPALGDFAVCTTAFGDVFFASVVRSGKVAGIQFHPEKSQRAGHALLRSVIEGLCDA